MPSPVKGFDANFLGRKLAFPKLDNKLCAPLLTGTGHEIVYTHFSVFVHKERRLPIMSACNIRGEAYNAEPREGTEPWDYSDQIEKAFQIDNEFYGNDKNTFDRGHLVRRVDPCWGVPEVANQAEAETFRWVNCTPQHNKLNRNGGVWFQLEQHIMEKGVRGKIADISVFAGPVLNSADKLFKLQYRNTDVPIPVVFWKIIVWKKADNKMYAVGFMMSQWQWIKHMLIEESAPAPAVLEKAVKPKLEDTYFENLEFSDHQTYQVPISAIAAATGIKFNWRNVRFPFVQKKFKPVTGEPVAKVFAFETINQTANELALSTNDAISQATLDTAVQEKEPLTNKQVELAVNNGMAGAIKRYELKGIQL